MFRKAVIGILSKINLTATHTSGCFVMMQGRDDIKLRCRISQK